MNTQISKYLLDIFYPNRCPCCGDFIKWDKLTCGRCHRELKPVYDNICRKCGKEICICSEDLYYDRAVSLFRYETLAKEGILAMKRSENKNFGEYSGKMITEILKSDFCNESFDFIVPVPMSKKSFLKRGFNQAEVIAKEISDAFCLPLRNDILYKENAVSSQHFLGRAERYRSISAIKAFDADITGKKVILCDDIITTGSTVNRCAMLLKEKGASDILLVCAAESRMK